MLCCRGKQDLLFVEDRMVLRTKAHDVTVPYSAIKHVAVSTLLGWLVVLPLIEHKPVSCRQELSQHVRQVSVVAGWRLSQHTIAGAPPGCHEARATTEACMMRCRFLKDCQGIQRGRCFSSFTSTGKCRRKQLPCSKDQSLLCREALALMLTVGLLPHRSAHIMNGKTPLPAIIIQVGLVVRDLFVLDVRWMLAGYTSLVRTT